MNNVVHIYVGGVGCFMSDPIVKPFRDYLFEIFPDYSKPVESMLRSELILKLQAATEKAILTPPGATRMYYEIPSMHPLIETEEAPEFDLESCQPFIKAIREDINDHFLKQQFGDYLTQDEDLGRRGEVWLKLGHYEFSWHYINHRDIRLTMLGTQIVIRPRPVAERLRKGIFVPLEDFDGLRYCVENFNEIEALCEEERNRAEYKEHEDVRYFVERRLMREISIHRLVIERIELGTEAWQKLVRYWSYTSKDVMCEPLTKFLGFDIEENPELRPDQIKFYNSFPPVMS